jgi:branched-chain amino acid aminotransferase
MEEMIYLNGSLVTKNEARISVADYGFLYGYGLFETMRAYNGKIFLLERHMNRLRRSAEVVGLGAALGKIDIPGACLETMQANNLKDARLRFTLTGGEADVMPWENKGKTSTVVITARPVTGPSPEKYEEGYKISVASLRRCNHSTLTHVKSTSYLTSVLARIEATARGLDEALLVNDDGYIAEGGSSNVFFIRSSRLVTPSVASGILQGITRELVIELAEEAGIPVTEGTVGMPIVRQCDEAFLTGSVMEIMPITGASDHSGRTVIVGSGKPGPITQQLMAAYRERVKKETGGG